MVIDHATINRWVIKFTPILTHNLRHKKKSVTGKWCYHYRAVDKFGNVVDYYLSQNRDEAAAKAFLNKTIAQNGLPSKVVIDGSKSNCAALDSMNIQLWLTSFFMLSLIEILDIKYLYQGEQSHRWVKQKMRQALGWKSWVGSQWREHWQACMDEKCGPC